MKKTTILIVDDELLIRIGIRNMIDFEEFEIIGEAENGEQALSQTESLSPDILLLDISMPSMNGVEVLKEIQRLKFRVKTIILSCHDDFKFVHTALTSGAVDYILKGELSKNQMYSSLCNIRDQILKENQTAMSRQLIGSNDLNSELLRKNLFLNLIYGQPLPKDPVNLLSEEFFPAVCLTFRIMRYAAVRARYQEGDIGFITQSLFSVLKQALLDLPTYELINVGENQFALLFALPKDRPAAAEVAEQTIEALIRLAKTYMNIDLSFGVGLPSDDFRGIHCSFKQALTALGAVFFHPKPAYQLYDPKKAGASEELTVWGNQLKKLCINRNYHQLAEAAVQFFSSVEDLPCTSPEDVKALFAGIANLLYLQEGNEGNNWESAIREADSLDELEDIFLHAIPGLYSGDEERSHITKNILQYIEKHYASLISVTTIADELGFSENHLSRVFNRAMGVGIPDYINRVRIEHAKELLQGTNLKIYAVAEKVGFNSVPYFNVIFKQLEQCTPNEYRNGLS